MTGAIPAFGQPRWDVYEAAELLRESSVPCSRVHRVYPPDADGLTEVLFDNKGEALTMFLKPSGEAAFGACTGW